MKRKSMEDIAKSSYRSGVSVHDPSIVVGKDGNYYIFGSHMEAAKSNDLWNWTSIASGVSKYNKLFDNLFTDQRAFEYVGKNDQGGYSVWAPDVIYNPAIGKYMMYFCTTSSYIKSNLCYAFADNIEGPYSYQGTILYSGFTRQSIDETNVFDVIGQESPGKYFSGSAYANLLWPNAIDPALFYDAEGRLWMSYGSWSGGIFILEIDKETGLPIHPEPDEKTRTDRYFGKHLAGGLHNSIEGPYIIYDETTGYYYLFVSYGSFVSEGGYQIRLFRSRNPDGPYTDSRGDELTRTAAHNNFGLKLMGNYTLPSLKIAYMAPGHNSAFINDKGELFVVYHQRFDDGNEYHEPRVHQLFRTDDGWLVAAPFNYQEGEGLLEAGPEDLAGQYFVVNHGTDISKNINNATEILLYKNGTVRDENKNKIGSWSVDKSTMEIILNQKTFNGVFIQQHDEGRNEVIAFSAASSDNESLWGVQYK